MITFVISTMHSLTVLTLKDMRPQALDKLMFHQKQVLQDLITTISIFQQEGQHQLVILYLVEETY